MTTIIFRYLVSEVFKSSLGIIMVLLIILMSNTLSSVLESIALGDLPDKALIPLLLKQAASLLTLVIPFAFFLGIIFAFGRLYKDYEMPVLNACGLGYRQMLVPIFALMIPFFCLDLFLSLSFSATAQRYAQESVDAFEQQDEFEQIEAGRFNVSSDGNQVFYMQSMSEDRSQLSHVIINQTNGDSYSFGIADKGVQIKDPKTGDLFLELSPGVRYEGLPGDADFKVIEYETHGVLIDLKQNTDKKIIKPADKAFFDLLKSREKADKIELQWRLATPFSLLVLGLVALPLSYVAPRKGRYGKMGVAILVYILYNNSLATMLVWIENNSIALELGFWLVHAIFLLLALTLVLKRNGALSLKRLTQ